MKNYIVFGAALCLALAMTSCKSSESAYKKAYDRARAQQTQQEEPIVTTPEATQQPTQPTTPQQVAPVQTVTTAPVASNEAPRTENVTLVSGAGLRAYSVVVGSFGVPTNAENRQRELINAGYQAQIAMNPNGMYRVVASTFDDLESAIQSRNVLRQQYPDAWLLRK